MTALSTIKEALQNRRERRSGMEMPAADLRLDTAARLAVNGQAVDLTEDVRAELARRVSVPAVFFCRCPPDLQAIVFNTLHSRLTPDRPPDERVSLVVQDGTSVVGLTDPDLALVSSAEVLDLVLQTRPEGLDEAELEVADFGLNGHFHLAIVSPRIQAEARVGDVVQAGIDVTHDDGGRCATQVRTYVRRLACLNGMLTRVCMHGSETGFRVRRAAAENAALTRRRIQDIARNAWGQIQATLMAIQDLGREPSDNAAEVIRAIGEKLRLGDGLIQEIIAALGEDELRPSGTLWDLVGAFSRVGTHSRRLSYRSRRYFQEISGDLVRERVARCPQCGAVRHGRLRYLPRR